MSWTERQGQVGDLSGQSREELREILSRQQHILDNKRFIQKLPDKGKKISEFAERVRLAISRHEEQERKQDALSFTEFQNKYQQAFSQQQHRGTGVAFSQHPRGAGPGVVHHNGLGDEEDEEEEDAARDGQTMETAVAVTTGGVSRPLSDVTEESELAEALGRVSLSHANANAAATGSSAGSASAAGEERREDAGADGAAMNNYFLGKHPQQQEKKKAHYMEVLAKNEHNQIPQRHKFRPNQLGPSSRGDSPSGGSLSPAGRSSPSGGGRSSPGVGGLLSPSPVLSVQERKERDRKHLDDITAARLPLLHCEPARLLSMTESAELLVTQTRRQQELQAKQAAQKLSEGLMKSSMTSSLLHQHHRDEGPTVGSSYHHLHHPYGGPTHHQHPDGGPTTAAYREEVHQHHDDDDDDDDGAGLSSEED